jgi:hypothetical protein
MTARAAIRSLSFRSPSEARESGIHTPGPAFEPKDLWLWIPGSPLRGAPE